MRFWTLLADDSYDLYTMDSKYIVPKNVSSTVRNVQEREVKQVNKFLESRLWNRSKTISYTVAKHEVQFFCVKNAHYSKTLDKLQSERIKFPFFTHLLIFCKTKEGDMEHFFSHENQVFNIFLSEHGSFRLAKRKSSMIKCILQKDFASPNEAPNISAKVFDGAAIIKMPLQRTLKIRGVTCLNVFNIKFYDFYLFKYIH